MRYPQRLSHLATRAVLAARFLPSYAQVHNLEDEEAHARLERALTGALLEEVLASTWKELLAGKKRLNEDGLLEAVARSLKERPLRQGRPTGTGPGWSAFWLQVDLGAGTASDAARKALESVAGKELASKGLEEAGLFLAAELTR